MKKKISIILCISLLSSIICIPVSATEDVVASESIEEFCEDVNEMVTEYSDSEFVTPDFIEEEQIPENTDEEIEINYCPRLIVQSDKPIDTYNAIEVVSGFLNFYILQFKNEEDTNYAYEQYKNDPNIISVEYDVSYDAFAETTQEDPGETTITFDEYKNDWSMLATGMDIVLDEFANTTLPEITVGVVDTGIDFNCTYLKDRIIETGFNSSGENNSESEQDYNGHGTMVSSIIAKCTTDNVKIANYRCGTQDGKLTTASASSAILQAINNKVIAINCSFTVKDTFTLMNEVINYAYQKNILIFSAAGNESANLNYMNGFPINTSSKLITVGSCDEYNLPSWFTSFGNAIDILAPGENITAINLNNNICIASGTSFSAPYALSVYAMLYSTHQTVPFVEKSRIIKGSGMQTDEKYVTGFFGSGIINAIELFELNTISEPTFTLNEGKYIGKVSIDFFSEEGADIYYTMDQTYPSPTNGILYTKPLEFEDDYFTIRAVAYKNGKRSNYVTKQIHSATPGTDDMFTITDDGLITAYCGNVKYLKIPEKINGITVIDIVDNLFTDSELIGVILPDTITHLGRTPEGENCVCEHKQNPFAKNSTIEYITGVNITDVGLNGLAFTEGLREVELPNCERIHNSGFKSSSLIGAIFPNVKYVGKQAFFEATYLREIYLPECIEIGQKAFTSDTFLSIVYIPLATYEKNDLFTNNYYPINDNTTSREMFSKCPELTCIDLPNFEVIGKTSFYTTAINRIEFSNIRYIYDLPNILKYTTNETAYSPYYLPLELEISLPSTLEYCVPATDYKNEYIEYVVYGTAGKESYVEQWAKENDIKFINISQETAIVEDIEPVWDKYSYKPLEFDARGFNRTYQWYGSKDKIQGNYDDKPMTNATDKTFNPDDYKSYPYYYCVMTSTDKNIKDEIVSQVTITSSMCQNRLYYMVALTNTHIDFDNHLIYTKTTGCKDLFSIIGIQDNTNYSSLPSLVYKEYYWYGTGSEFVIFNGTQKERYTLIVEGDVTGDSSVDVIDATSVELVTNGHKQLTDIYFLAADTNLDQEITVEDYAQVVNLVLAG